MRFNDALNRLAQEKLELETHLQTLQSQMDLLSYVQQGGRCGVHPCLGSSERAIDAA